MVAQDTLLKCNQAFYKNNFKFEAVVDVNNCLEQIKFSYSLNLRISFISTKINK